VNADPGAKPLGIGGNRHRGFSRRRKQQTVDRGFVVVGNIGEPTLNDLRAEPSSAPHPPASRSGSRRFRRDPYDLTRQPLV
jgi:hypothetical protein